ncbi:MAG: TRAP transporter substrate-binding protein DctP [Hyphomicrobiaceae bacterium]
MTFPEARRLAGLASSIAILTLVTAPPTLAQDIIKWNHNWFGPKREVTRGTEVAAELVNKTGKGKVELTVHYGAALGPPKTVPEAIKSGGYEGGNMCAGYYPNKFPLLTVMELPFLAPTKTADRAKVDIAVLKHPAVQKEMKDRWGIFPWLATTLPAYEFMGNKKIASTADMKGVKMRISGLNAKALAKFGAVPANVPAPETYTALERGTIDTIGFPYSYTFGAYRLYEVSKYFTEGMSMSGFMCFQGISLKMWNKLPPEVKNELEVQRAASEKALVETYAAADKKWIPLFKSKLEVSQFPAAERKKLQGTAAEIWADWVKDQEKAGRPGKALLEFVKAEVAKYK